MSEEKVKRKMKKAEDMRKSIAKCGFSIQVYTIRFKK
jgi:hypothetical protein